MALNYDADKPLAIRLQPPGNLFVSALGLSDRSRDLYAIVVDNVISPEDCKEIIRVTEERGYGKALVNVGGGRQVLMDGTKRKIFPTAFLILFFSSRLPKKRSIYV
jgi:hypothetical protein